MAETVQQDNGPSEVVDTTREKDLEEKMRLPNSLTKKFTVLSLYYITGS